MNKIGVFVIALMLACSSLFAMGSQGKYSPLGDCYKREDVKCISTCGDPNNPNFPHSVKNQSAVTGVTYNTNPDGSFTWDNPSYDPNKKTYDPVCFSNCTAPGYTLCRATYKN